MSRRSDAQHIKLEVPPQAPTVDPKLAAQLWQWREQVKAGAEDTSYHREYLECKAQRPEAECGELFSKALWVGYMDGVRNLSGILGYATKFFGEGSADVLRNTIADSSDPYERVTALLILNHDDTIERREHDPRIYQSIADRTPTEGVLVLSTHLAQTAPIRTPESLAVVRGLAAEPTTEVGLRNAAIKALGHPENATDLMDVLRSPDPELSMDAAAHALSRCGAQCLPLLKEWAAGGNDEQRIYAFQVASHFGNDEDRDHARLVLSEYKDARSGKETEEQLQMVEDFLRREQQL